METNFREILKSAAIVVSFFILFGIVGRMEMNAMTERETAYNECRAMLVANDWDATGCVGRFEDLSQMAREMWGPDGDPETGKDN